MTLLTTLNLLLELAVQYLRLKIKTSTYDIIEKFDARLDKLDQKRQKLRAANNSAAQKEADEVLAEIIEEKKKLKIFLEEQKLVDKTAKTE
jgi:hypothetical protein